MIAWYAALSSLEQCFALIAIAATTFLFLQTGMMIFGLGLHSDSDDGGFESHDHDGLDGQADIGGHDGLDVSFDSDFDHDFDAPGEVAVDFGDTDMDFDTADDAPDTSMDVSLAEVADHDFDQVVPDSGSGSKNGIPVPADPGLRLFTMRGMVAFFALFGWSGLVALQSKWDLPAVLGAAFVAGSIGCYTVAKVLQIFLRLQDSGNVRLENAIGLEGEVYLRIPADLQGRGKVTMLLQERFVELEAVTRNDTDLKPGSPVYVIALLDEDTVVVQPKNQG